MRCTNAIAFFIMCRLPCAATASTHIKIDDHKHTSRNFLNLSNFARMSQNRSYCFVFKVSPFKMDAMPVAAALEKVVEQQPQKFTPCGKWFGIKTAKLPRFYTVSSRRQEQHIISIQLLVCGCDCY